MPYVPCHSCRRVPCRPAPAPLSYSKELVSDLETRISRYLDGESSPAEQAELRELFERSPEARVLLREMTVLRRAARKLPTLDAPRRMVETRLFRQLEVEGLAPVDDDAVPAPLLERTADISAMSVWRSVVRYGTAVAAVAVLVLMFGSERLIAPGSGAAGEGGNISAGRSIAALTAPLPETIASGADSHLKRAVAAVHSTIHRREAAIGTGGGSIDGVGSDVAAIASNSSTDTLHAPLAMTMQSAMQAGDPAVPSVENQAPVASLRRALGSAMGVAPQRSTELSNVRIHRASQVEESSFAASIRPGVSYIGKGGGLMAQEMSIRFDASLGQNHHISLIAGRAPTVSETHTDRTPLPQSLQASATRSDSKGSGLNSEIPPAAASLPARTPASGSVLNVQSETWLGLGYTYTIAPVEGFHVGAGVRAGSSASAWRMGFELPVRYQMMPGVSFEAVPSATLVAPRDRSPEAYTADGTAGDYTYQGTTQQLSFTSIGLEVGLRIEFGGH